jgi:SAM-dependent methyltransferase
MTGPFGALYAAAYDALYEDKDYTGECELFEAIFGRFAARPVRSVLDLGCGTGGHAIPLARRGYAVVGVDRSAAMLARARTKASGWDGPAPPTFRAGDLRALDLGRKFDVALMPFAVLGYLGSNADLLAALRATRRHLRAGGLFICDVWYGPAVLRLRPGERIKVARQDQTVFLRVAKPTLDVSHQQCVVAYQLWRLERGTLVSEAEETHTMRFFFPQELALLLACAGFGLEQLTAFPDVTAPADESTWNALVVARAVRQWSGP